MGGNKPGTRRIMRLAAVVLAVAYLLPLLLTFLPSPATAAEQALFADLMQSRCLDSDGDGKPDPGSNGSLGHECCILCPAQPNGLRAEVAVEPVVFARTVVARPPYRTVDVAIAHPLRLQLQPLSRRGPPA